MTRRLNWLQLKMREQLTTIAFSSLDFVGASLPKPPSKWYYASWQFVYSDDGAPSVSLQCRQLTIGKRVGFILAPCPDCVTNWGQQFAPGIRLTPLGPW